MPSVWTALSRGRDGVIALREGAIERTRRTGADLLGAAEHRAVELQGRLAARRVTLNGRAIEKVEKRLLSQLEAILDRMGIGLRAQAQRLTPGASMPETLPAPKRKRIRVPVGETASAAPAKARAKKGARPSARSTRWVARPEQTIEALAELPVKALLAKLPELADVEKKALLAHERATKKRKTVLAALSAN